MTEPVTVPPDTPTPSRWAEWVPIDDLPDDPRNPKAHADADIDASMDRFGYTEPVMIDERTGMLVSGHGRKARLVARRNRGERPPDGIEVDEQGRWTVLVARGWRSRSDAEAGAYLIAANQLTTKGGWSNDPLTDLLVELSDGPGLDGTGFTSTDLDDLLVLRDPSLWDDPRRRDHDDDPNDDPNDHPGLAPMIELRVTDDIFDGWRTLLDRYTGDDDVAKLVAHLRDVGVL